MRIAADEGTLPTTGYIRGGCSPIGMKKHFPTYVHETAAQYDYVYVSAGQRGLQVNVVAPGFVASRQGRKYARFDCVVIVVSGCAQIGCWLRIRTNSLFHLVHWIPSR